MKSYGSFSPEKNGELFRKAADFFHDTLGIKLCRTYSQFEEYSPPFVGVSGVTLEKVGGGDILAQTFGGTLSQALEMMAKGEWDEKDN